MVRVFHVDFVLRMLARCQGCRRRQVRTLPDIPCEAIRILARHSQRPERLHGLSAQIGKPTTGPRFGLSRARDWQEPIAGSASSSSPGRCHEIRSSWRVHESVSPAVAVSRQSDELPSRDLRQASEPPSAHRADDVSHSFQRSLYQHASTTAATMEAPRAAQFSGAQLARTRYRLIGGARHTAVRSCRGSIEGRSFVTRTGKGHRNATS